ncbi:uncharacterized protein LOC126912164 [Spodoptera frugiperda]|uniref:Uncharacterized protein LOC126912164 n=1 Tax=Spodoptera frugiperda TaxID=7108 RepID=A0A9R0E5R5_SPOFR|nr:uncharacterized protein LOC126912164 [Spodoptera frugiperda]
MFGNHANKEDEKETHHSVVDRGARRDEEARSHQQTQDQERSAGAESVGRQPVPGTKRKLYEGGQKCTDGELEGVLREAEQGGGLGGNLPGNEDDRKKRRRCAPAQRRSSSGCGGSVELLAETFYPEDREDDDDSDHCRTRQLAKLVNACGDGEQHDPPFTLSELQRSISSFNPKKAPGADGFTADICSRAINCNPGYFLSLINRCLAYHHFPKTWKEATVVVLRKPGKDKYTVPKSYRPIGLLPVLGKVFEKMLVARLKFHLLPRISTRQYGFRPQRSTKDSLFTLVKNIRAKLESSIGGPILWNLLLDPLLKQLEARGDYCQAFADDVVMLFDGGTALEIEQQANAALEHVRAWGVKNKLKFAPHKTSAMVITRKLKYDTPRLAMGGIDIGMSKEVKILGLTIDAGLTFNSHVAGACKKAIAIYKHLARSARVSWGLHPEVVRSIYTAVVEPIVLYAASAWAPAVNKLGIRKQLNVVQRGFAQKLCRAHRTVSLHSALLLAGILPSIFECVKLLHSEQTTVEFSSLVDEEQYNNHAFNYDVRIFTDGSKIEGKVGAALSLWDSATEIKSKKLVLPSYCTVYQAELLALQRAAGEALNSEKTTFGIFSDSMAALQTVANPTSPHPLAVEARNALRHCASQNKRVSLFWIKAHAGLEGNERADYLAKEAALRSKRRPDYDRCPVSFVRGRIRMDTISEWDARYKSGDTASITKLFFPSAAAAYSTVRKIETSSITTQLFTGHGGFSEYLYRFKLRGNPSCPCDSTVEETVPHVIFACPVYARARHEVEQRLEGEKFVPQDIHKHIKKAKTRNVVLDFCKHVVSQVIAKNKS